MRKRKSKNLGGRPVTVDASASYLLKLQPWLLKAARAAAEGDGIGLAEWLRRAAQAALPKKKTGKGR